ncbi:MAG: SLBB domain-containing protein [Candidatus Acidiferrales bacterium]
MTTAEAVGRATLRRATRTCAFVLASALLSLLFGTVLRAQSQQQARVPGSELSRENFNQVAASAAQIKTVLVMEPGLVVELKRWIAKDATDQGQIVSESDLTDDAIFERLQTDVRFRSVATLLLQRYGYLVPRVNPDSELGKQQELLVQERVKWIAQEEEQVRSQAAAKAQDRFEKARQCEQGEQSSCPERQQQQQPAGRPLPPQGQGAVPGYPPGLENPNQMSPPSFPQGQGNGNLERAQLMQTGESGDESFAFLSGNNVGSSDYLQGPGGLGGVTGNGGAMMSSPLQQFQNGDGGSLGPSLSGGTSTGLQGGPFDQYTGGAAPGSSFGQTDVNPFEANGATQYGGGTGTDRNLGSYYGYREPFNRTYQNQQLRPIEMVQRPSPYQDIPSLYDMYMQALPRPTTPQRFGMNVFENQSENPDFIPMDLPAGPDYVVGPGDGLAINLWGGVSRRIYGTVDREGRVSLPEVGPVLVSGKSLAEVQQSVQQVLRTQFRDVSVDVSLARLRTIRVYIVGDVANPGAYDVSSLSTPLNALFVAGGPTSGGSLRIVKHFRGNQLIQTVDLYDLLLYGVRSDIQRLENGDSIMAPPIGPQVTIAGMVRRPAIYELRDEKNLSRVLELAGGLLPTATLRHIEVQRTVSHQKQTMLSLDIPASDDDSEATKKLDSFQIQDGDRIRVFPIDQGDEDAVYLDGHVVRPGRYSYHASMRVTDLISSYKDLLPEPALQYAEIIRLNPPDFHPTTESFALQDALANPSQAPILHAMDTVRIFSRFDFENPPTVSVLGDVRAPGTYQTSGQVHLADAVHLAGGLAPDAQIDDAQVFRSLPDGRAKIFSVSLSQALAGDPMENIMLEPRDRLLIHKSSNAEQPASVYIEGEVGKPGRYPLTGNMTVADLIRVGGGLEPSADTRVADLTTFQWASDTKLTGQHETISISAAMKGDPQANTPLHNGDVLTVRQLPEWNDLGATITVKGDVKDPGTYGIRPGERVSSILERAGGFLPSAYPYGAILTRVEVRQLETKERDKLILRVKDAEGSLQNLPETTPAQKQAKEMALAQYQTTLMELNTNPPLGRVTIRISSRIDRWKNTAADIDVRAGDTLFIPKRPDYVMVTGEVFNPAAVSYRPGKSAKWYLSQSGGPTTTANKKEIFVIRADGSVAGEKGSLWGGDSLDATLQPGDAVVVPEKTIGGGPNWANVFTTASVASSIVSTVFIATHY